MEKVLDLDTFLEKMNKKIILKDLNNKTIILKILRGLKNIFWNFMVVVHQFMKKTVFFLESIKNLEKIFLKFKNLNN